MRESQHRRHRSFNERMMLFLMTVTILFPIQQFLFLHYYYYYDGGLNNSLPVATVVLRPMKKDTIEHEKKSHLETKRTSSDNTDNDDYSFLTMYGSHRALDSIKKLPAWLQNYIKWHRDQTQNASNHTKYVIITCMPKDGFCGGLSDRLRPLPFLLLFASQVPRVLCIHFLKPQSLENFLLPPSNGLDWRCPPEVASLLDESKETAKQPIIRAYNIDRCNSKNQIVPCAQTKIDYMRKDDGKYLSIKLVSNDVASINKALYLFQRHSYVDRMPSLDNWAFVDLMGDIFRVMFEPITPLAIRINQTMAQLGLVENHYSSVHTRCRYPVYPAARHQGKQVDKEGGLLFANKTKDALIDIMENAINCAHQLDPHLPIYFASDHDDATRYMITHDTHLNSTQYIRPVGINRKEEPLHMGNLEESHEHKAIDYFSIFEDLLIIGGSKCVAHGVGSFGSFGAAITGNRCRAIHRKFNGALVKCPNDRALKRLVPITEPILYGQNTQNNANLVADLQGTG